MILLFVASERDMCIMAVPNLVVKDDAMVEGTKAMVTMMMMTVAVTMMMAYEEIMEMMMKCRRRAQSPY